MCCGCFERLERQVLRVIRLGLPVSARFGGAGLKAQLLGNVGGVGSRRRARFSRNPPSAAMKVAKTTVMVKKRAVGFAGGLPSDASEPSEPSEPSDVGEVSEYPSGSLVHARQGQCAGGSGAGGLGAGGLGAGGPGAGGPGAGGLGAGGLGAGVSGSGSAHLDDRGRSAIASAATSPNGSLITSAPPAPKYPARRLPPLRRRPGNVPVGAASPGTTRSRRTRPRSQERAGQHDSCALERSPAAVVSSASVWLLPRVRRARGSARVGCRVTPLRWPATRAGRTGPSRRCPGSKASSRQSRG